MSVDLHGRIVPHGEWADERRAEIERLREQVAKLRAVCERIITLLGNKPIATTQRGAEIWLGDGENELMFALSEAQTALAETKESPCKPQT